MGLDLSTFFHVLDLDFEPVTQASTNGTGNSSLHTDQVASTRFCISIQTNTFESENAQAFAPHEGTQAFVLEGEDAQVSTPTEGAQAFLPEDGDSQVFPSPEGAQAFLPEGEDAHVFAPQEGLELFTPECPNAQAAFVPHKSTQRVSVAQEGAQASEEVNPRALAPDGWDTAAFVPIEGAQALVPEVWNLDTTVSATEGAHAQDFTPHDDPRAFVPESWNVQVFALAGSDALPDEEQKANATIAGEERPETVPDAPRYHAIMCNADADEETAWHITQQLENRYGLNIFYPPRDLLYGGDHCTVVAQSVLACDVAICLATHNTLACDMYDFTVKFACFHSIGARNRRSLIVIKMAEDAPIQQAVQPLLSMNYYDSHRRPFFWYNLARSILGLREAPGRRATADHFQAAHRPACRATAARAGAVHPQASRVEATRPEADHPEAVRAESTRTEASGSEAAHPDAKRAEANRSDTNRYEAYDYGGARPKTSRPTATRSEATRHETTRPDAKRQTATRSEATQYEVTRPEATRPEATQYEDTRPEDTRHGTTRPEDTGPEDTRHGDTRSETTRSGDTRLDALHSEDDIYLEENNTADASLPVTPCLTVPVSESQMEADLEAYNRSATASIVANSVPASPAGPDCRRVCKFTDPLSSMAANDGSLNKN